MKTTTLLKFDIISTLIMLVFLTLSLFFDRFSIYPNVNEKFLGVNNFNIILLNMNQVLVATALVMLVKTVVFLRILKAHHETESKVINFYLFKWAIFLTANILPYIYNTKPPIVFIIFHILMFLLFLYRREARV